MWGLSLFHAKNSDVSWTVDIPKEALPDLPPLPDGIRQQFEDVISRDAKQQPSWDTLLAQNVRKILESVPPIVVAPEVRELERQLAAVANGEAFLLQGGDCAETFESNTEPHIHAKDRKSTRLNSSHTTISYAVFCLKKTKYPPD